jgi:hypothetical protein
MHDLSFHYRQRNSLSGLRNTGAIGMPHRFNSLLAGVDIPPLLANTNLAPQKTTKNEKGEKNMH